MNVVKATILAATVAVASLGMGVTANAAPLSSAAKAVSATDNASVQQVHYRRYRHGHRHYYRNKYRHRHYGYYRGYRGPGVSLYIGPRYGHRHHRRYWR